MTLVLESSKRTLLFWTVIFIACTEFCSPALAKQLTSNFILDTDVRFQATDIDNADLGTSGSDNTGTGALEARMKLTGTISENMLFVWAGRAVFASDNVGFQNSDTGSISTGGTFFEWRQSYLQFNDLGSPQTSIRIGRQKLRDDYGLWWNQDFDAVRLTYDTTLFKGALIGGQNLFSYRTGDGDFTNNQKDIARVLAEGSWQYYYDHFFETRLAFQDDHSGIAVGDVEDVSDPDDRDGNLYWAGIRAAGKTPALMAKADKMSYRVDLMTVHGNEEVATIVGGVITAVNGKHVRGWGIDASTDIPLPNMKPVIHLGYAFGSGDGDTTDGTDHGFRQSGLQGNFSRFGALSDNTDNYGTVLKPQLSNIHVLSAGVTMPVLEASDVGVIYRYYCLDEPATSLASSGVSNTLDGVNRQLGQGLDLLFNMNVLKEKQVNTTQVQDVAFRSSLGFFRSGNAYGAADGETAVRGLVELKVGF